MLLEQILSPERRDLLVIKAHAAGPKRLFVAFEGFVHETKAAATRIVSVDLETLAVELVHEIEGSSIDYVHADGWHALLQRGAVIELVGGKPIVTDAKLREGGRLAGIARAGDVTVVCGADRGDNHAIDGFVAKIEGGKLARLLELPQLGPIDAVCAGAKHIFAGGGVQAGGRFLLYRGDTRAFDDGVPVSSAQIFSLHAKSDGAVMVGCHRAATLFAGAAAEELTGVYGEVTGVTVFRGEEYWLSHDGVERMTVWRRTGTKLKSMVETKHHYIGYRNVDGAPAARMTATEDYLVVTNKERIHIYDGKKWAQLAIQPKVKKPIKRLPAAMKA